MIDALSLLFALFVFVCGLVALGGGGGIVRVRRNKEWTRFENGRPVCGVGPRGYWTNTRIVGEWPYEQRKDGSWFNPETGNDVITMNLKEFLDWTRKREILAGEKGSRE